MAILPSSWDPGRLGVNPIRRPRVPVAKSSLDEKPHHGMPQDRAQPLSAQCPPQSTLRHFPRATRNDRGSAQGAFFAMTIKQVTKRSHGFKSRRNDTHPSSAFELSKASTSPDYNLGKLNGG